jgi:CheY-like chemotaxis protein
MSSNTPLTVLVADDDDSIRFPIVSILEDYGYQVLEAITESDLIDQAPKAAVWIVDVRLPSRAYEGLLGVAQLVKSGTMPRFPVLFISVDAASYADAELNALRDLGVQFEWLEKPFELELLLEKLKDFRNS